MVVLTEGVEEESYWSAIQMTIDVVEERMEGGEGMGRVGGREGREMHVRDADSDVHSSSSPVDSDTFLAIWSS